MSADDAHYLTKLFAPRSVAVFGASPRADSVGGVVFDNLARGFRGPLHAVNPKHERIGDRPCHKSVADVGEPIELAVIVTPAATIPAILEECGKQGVGAAVILSAGFREAGEAGKALEREVLQVARRHGIRFIGPNCLGLMRPDTGLNTTFYHGSIRPGRIGLVSQSGAICTTILDWAEEQGIGFSSVVSVGASADVDFGEILDFLTLDRRTESILLYVEGIRHARSFVSGLRAAARLKPVIVLKAGRYDSGAQAALSHTGALVGSSAVFDAACKRAGAVRVDTTLQLFAAAEVLSCGRRATGDRLAVVTNGGGLGVLAADAAAGQRIPLAQLAEPTLRALDAVLPAAWPRKNPVDILGDATPDRYAAAVRICLDDPAVDGLVVMLAPQGMTRAMEGAEAVVEAIRDSRKPILACWMGGKQVREAQQVFVRAEVPCFEGPVPAVEAFGYLVAHRRNQALLLETPGPLADPAEPDLTAARAVFETARKDGRRLLSMMESKALLAAFRIPVTRALLARSAGEAQRHAAALGFPVALKVHSTTITHKADIGGVRLGLHDAAAVGVAYEEMLDAARRRGLEAQVEGITVERMLARRNPREVMIGIVRDPTFGPVISFGLGGHLVELIEDQALTLPPLNEKIIERVIARTRAAKILQAFRGAPPVDRSALVQVLLRVSEMACELEWLDEMDLNPVIVDEHGAVAVDARVVVDPSSEPTTPYAHLAIHPYPTHLVRTYRAADGTEVKIRPIRPEDARIEKDFVDRLTPRSRYFRFMGGLKELTRPMLVRFTQIDYDREMAFIAVTGTGSSEKEIAVGRYVTYADGESCEFAIVVDDAWQGKGLGYQIMSDLIAVARGKGLKTMFGEISSDNTPMLRLASDLGFSRAPEPDDPAVTRAVKDLTAHRSRI